MPAQVYPVYLPLGTIPGEALATLTHPTPATWGLEMHNGVDNRLTAEYIRTCLQVALDIVERDWRSAEGAPGALVISGGKDQEKFFSNGAFRRSLMCVGCSLDIYHCGRSRLRERCERPGIYDQCVFLSTSADLRAHAIWPRHVPSFPCSSIELPW